MAVSVHSPKRTIEQHVEVKETVYVTSPMPPYGETLANMWHSTPIAPPMLSAQDVTPMDFTQSFVHKCLYPSQSFLIAEGFTTEEEIKARTPRKPRDPQPDYFGHLLGHPISIEEEDEGDSEGDDSVDTPAEVEQDPVDVEDFAAEDGVPEAEHEAAEELPDDRHVRTESDKDQEVSEDSTDDADADYFGHIMGHSMKHSGSQSRTKKTTKTAESEEAEGSVLGLFLGGVEVCDREENIGQFTSRNEAGAEDVDEKSRPKKSSRPGDKADVQEVSEDVDVPEVVEKPKVAPPKPEQVEQKTDRVVIEEPSRDPEVVQPQATLVEAKQPQKQFRPTEFNTSGPARPAAKKKSFFAGLCGSRNLE